MWKMVQSFLVCTHYNNMVHIVTTLEYQLIKIFDMVIAEAFKNAHNAAALSDVQPRRRRRQRQRPFTPTNCGIQLFSSVLDTPINLPIRTRLQICFNDGV